MASVVTEEGRRDVVVAEHLGCDANDEIDLLLDVETNEDLVSHCPPLVVRYSVPESDHFIGVQLRLGHHIAQPAGEGEVRRLDVETASRVGRVLEHAATVRGFLSSKPHLHCEPEWAGSSLTVLYLGTMGGLEGDDPAVEGVGTPTPRFRPGCLALALVVCAPVVAIIVSSYNVRRYDEGYVVNSLGAGVTVGAAWLIVPVAFYVLATLSIGFVWKVGTFAVVILAILFLTANVVTLKGPEPGMHGENVSEGRDILMATFRNALDPAFQGKWRVNTDYPRSDAPFYCTDQTFGRQRPAQQVSLEIDVDGGVNGAQLDAVVDRLRAAGWHAEAQNNGTYQGVRGRVLRASRDGYTFESSVT